MNIMKGTAYFKDLDSESGQLLISSCSVYISQNPPCDIIILHKIYDKLL